MVDIVFAIIRSQSGKAESREKREKQNFVARHFAHASLGAGPGRIPSARVVRFRRRRIWRPFLLACVVVLVSISQCR